MVIFTTKESILDEELLFSYVRELLTQKKVGVALSLMIVILATRRLYSEHSGVQRRTFLHNIKIYYILFRAQVFVSIIVTNKILVVESLKD